MVRAVLTASNIAAPEFAVHESARRGAASVAEALCDPSSSGSEASARGECRFRLRRGWRWRLRRKAPAALFHGGSPLLASASLPASSHALGIRALFDEMDTNKDGLVTEMELLDFAARRSLPKFYVREFMTKVHLGRPGPTFVRYPWLRREEAGGPGLRFTDFARFVNAKEAALQESFQKIDTDQDGFISVRDLQKALKDVHVCSWGDDRRSKVFKFCGGESPGCAKLCRVKRSQVQCLLAAVDTGAARWGSAGSRKCADAGSGREIMMDYNKFRDFFVLLPDTAVLFDYWMDSTCTTFRGCDIGCQVQLSNKQNQMTSSMQSLNHLVAGAVAGAVSRTTTAPMETLRLRMMVGPAGVRMRAQLRDLLRESKRTHGKALFAGNGANVARSAPQKGIDFFAFSLYKRAFQRLLQHMDCKEGQGRLKTRLESLTTLAAGALAGATSCVALYPLDVARSRLTTQGEPRVYKGIVDCLQQIRQKEGVRGMYTGLRPSIIGILPEAAIAYGCFDLLKQGYARMVQIPEDEVGAVPAMLCGMLSAFTGQLVAYPLEVLARRAQVRDASILAAGLLPSALHIARTESLGSLYAGIVPASVRVLPMAAVSFATYELVSTLLNAPPPASASAAAATPEGRAQRVDLAAQAPAATHCVRQHKLQDLQDPCKA